MTDIKSILKGLNLLKHKLEKHVILQEWTASTTASLQIDYMVSMDYTSAFAFATIVDSEKIPLMIHFQKITDEANLDDFKMTVEKELKSFVNAIFIKGMNEACMPLIFKD